MIQKICPFCRLDSYSAYNDPNWLCPYCGQNIGDSRSKEFISRKRKRLSTGKARQIHTCSSGGHIRDHLRVVSYNSGSFPNCQKEVK